MLNLISDLLDFSFRVQKNIRRKYRNCSRYLDIGWGGQFFLYMIYRHFISEEEKRKKATVLRIVVGARVNFYFFLGSIVVGSKNYCTGRE